MSVTAHLTGALVTQIASGAVPSGEVSVHLGDCATCRSLVARELDVDLAQAFSGVLAEINAPRSRLGERAWARLRGPVQTVHLLWLNNFRYMDERRLRRYLNDVMFYRRIKKRSDTLKLACIELMDAALQIVTIGDERWRNP